MIGANTPLSVKADNCDIRRGDDVRTVARTPNISRYHPDSHPGKLWRALIIKIEFKRSISAGLGSGQVKPWALYALRIPGAHPNRGIAHSKHSPPQDTTNFLFHHRHYARSSHR